MNRNRIPIVSAVAALALLTAGSAHAAGSYNVACVGDSITAGLYVNANQCYPSQLASMLSGSLTVGNFGQSGTTALKVSNDPYWGTRMYDSSLRSRPSYVIIMFGANDSSPVNWNGPNFVADYESLISSYATLGTNPKVIACYCTPYFLPTPWPNNFPDPTRIPNLVLPAIQQAVSATGVATIDNYDMFVNQPQLFVDGVHPNVDGHNMMAINAYNAVTGANISLLTGANINDGGGPWGGNTANSAAAAFDNNSTTYYDAANANTGWDGIDLGAGNTKKVQMICYSPRYGSESRMVGGLFQGSNDGTTWNNLAPAISSSPGDTYNIIKVSGAPAYRYLRYASPANGFCNVGEIKFFGN
jgi:lysophospholipase L1-like esterase